MTHADVCLIVEGGYPYVLGGVASWSDAYMRASPQLSFHVIAITLSSQPKQRRYVLPDNAVGLTDVFLDVCPVGRPARQKDAPQLQRIFALIERALTVGDGPTFSALAEELRTSGFGQAALLDSREAWTAMEDTYGRLLTHGPLLDFFWSWRFLVRSLLSLLNTPLPEVDVFHSLATGFAGVVGSYAKVAANRPLVLTEHGIYTNERRIELGVADWLFDSGAGGYRPLESTELRAIWLQAFRAFSQTTYALADIITTQYRANQTFQRIDGAPDDKLRIIPNGIDAARLGTLPRAKASRPPTVLMVARIVPIKDIRTFIVAVAMLKEIVPDVVAILIGPEDEDPEYAASCRQLAHQLGADTSMKLLGRVPDVLDYFLSSDVLALSSISEAQPIAVLEAAATGIPIVSTDVGSCREIIEGFPEDPVQGRGGYIVEACNPKAMAEALAKVLLDHTQRREMADVMQRRVANYYEKNRVQRLYEGVYAGFANSSADHAHDQHQQRH